MPSGLPLVALGAALWGTDALFRRGLALDLPATTVVMWEHVVLVLVMLPVLRRVPWRTLDRGDWIGLLLIGIGASALATVLFTAAFSYGDPNTPLLLQKLQPFVVIIGARLILGERMTPRFWIWFAAAVFCGWLITFPSPTEVTVSGAAPGALGAGAAALWGMGTVLGRRLRAPLTAVELAAARFAVGLPATFVLTRVGPGRTDVLGLERGDIVPVLLLALVPGLMGMLAYYRGLGRTRAGVATLGELAFPMTALVVNAIAFGAVLAPLQAVGLVGLLAVLLAMTAASRAGQEQLGIH